MEQKMHTTTKKKKAYIAPSIEIVEFEIQSSILAVSGTDTLPGTGTGGDSEGGMEGDANRRRGEWGNLWESKSRW